MHSYSITTKRQLHDWRISRHRGSWTKLRGWEGTRVGVVILEGDKVLKWKRPETGLFVEFTRHQKSGSDTRECQCLDTALNLRRDFMGRQMTILVRRSTLPMIDSAWNNGIWNCFWGFVGCCPVEQSEMSSQSPAFLRCLSLKSLLTLAESSMSTITTFSIVNMWDKTKEKS